MITLLVGVFDSSDNFIYNFSIFKDVTNWDRRKLRVNVMAVIVDMAASNYSDERSFRIAFIRKECEGDQWYKEEFNGDFKIMMRSNSLYSRYYKIVNKQIRRDYG